MTHPTDHPVDTAPADSLATNRQLPIIPAAQLPVVPSGFRSTPIDDRRQRLRVLAGAQKSESKEALREVTGNAATFRQDLGEFAPDPAAAPALLKRLEDLEAALARTRALTAYYEELEDIAVSDAAILLESAHKEFEHRLARMPHLAERYRALKVFFDARSAAIAEGKARAKAKKETVTEPA